MGVTLDPLVNPSVDPSVTVLYFAVLADQANLRREIIGLQIGDTPLSVDRRLASKYGFQLAADDLRMAVNEEFSPADVVLKSGDSLALIPPVAGG